jgi:membrane associated rhomboid family serine protease
MWVFGASVEARLGRVRFLPFVLACGSLAIIVEALATPSGLNPIIGGSGMVAGVLGAYIVVFPSARVWALLIVIPVRLPAWVLLVVWFGYQLIAALAGFEAGTAYWAHVAGFAIGALLIRPVSTGLPPPPIPRSRAGIPAPA